MGESADDDHHPRLILHDFISLDLCKELEFIHKSCSTVGYRPNVFSTTLSHLIATNSAHLIVPFISIRETLKDKVEEFFGCEYQLFIEFTGLISWTKGASIGWHSDDNRSYLKQRDFAAVCYLNNHGKDFRGGLFHFQDGEPAIFVPKAGDVLMYTADSRNIHSVDEITDGERLTLTLWFSRDNTFDEDAKLISLISQSPMSNQDEDPFSYLPLPAPNDMYRYSSEQASHQSGFDVRWARVHILGYNYYFLEDKILDFPLDSSKDDSELMAQPLWLGRGDEIFNKEFANSLHVLQIVQFCYWKISAGNAINLRTDDDRDVKLSTERSVTLKSVPLGDHELAVMVFGSIFPDEYTQNSFDWAHFSAGVVEWEDYTLGLREELLRSLPQWRTNQALFIVPSECMEKCT